MKTKKKISRIFSPLSHPVELAPIGLETRFVKINFVNEAFLGEPRLPELGKGGS